MNKETMERLLEIYNERAGRKMNEKTKSRHNETVYSATYNNGGWPERDKLPESDPIGDVEFSIQHGDFYKNLKKQCIKPEDKYAGQGVVLNTPDGRQKEVYIDNDNNVAVRELEIPVNFTLDMDNIRVKGAPLGGCCDKPDKYKNIISNSLKFYSCRNCGSDLGDC